MEGTLCHSGSPGLRRCPAAGQKELATMSHRFDTVVVGAGIFGVTAAIELTRRGQRVALIDPGPLPHPMAASTDISKVVRLEYGADLQYMIMMERVREEWLRWNDELASPLYHETGVAMITRSPMAPGGFEHDSYTLLLQRGHQPERLDADELMRHFPAWRTGAFVDGFYHARGGYAESGLVVAALVEQAGKLGVHVWPGQTAERLLDSGPRVTGVATREGERFSADWVVLAAGAWTPLLVPELASGMQATGHPVFHLQPARPEPFRSPAFSVFTADIANSGWYGFPLHPREGVIKIANHGVGKPLHPEHDERVVTQADHAALRVFLRDALPDLADAPVTFTRRCLYCDTRDGHFVIDRHPERPGLCVATGGSGHAFKFAPLLGPLIADAVMGQDHPHATRFRWRELSPSTISQEAARHRG